MNMMPGPSYEFSPQSWCLPSRDSYEGNPWIGRTRRPLQGKTLQNCLAEGRIRAERKAGKLLKEMDKPLGGRPAKKTGSTMEPNCQP